MEQINKYWCQYLDIFELFTSISKILIMCVPQERTTFNELWSKYRGKWRQQAKLVSSQNYFHALVTSVIMIIQLVCTLPLQIAFWSQCRYCRYWCIVRRLLHNYRCYSGLLFWDWKSAPWTQMAVMARTF